MKALIKFLLILFLASFCGVLLWNYFYSDVLSVIEHPTMTKDESASSPRSVKKILGNITNSDFVNKLLENYSSSWEKKEKDFQKYRLLLQSCCNAVYNAVVTQENSPIGTNITYFTDLTKTIKVTPDLFRVFPKENPFKKAPWKTCAVVGNGAILANSSCGKQIDSAEFIIRANFPPLNNGHERDTGIKTNLVTANPSILIFKYGALNERRRSFVEDANIYGTALLLLPTFSFSHHTSVTLRAFYTLEDFGNPGPHVVINNPAYLISLKDFWINQGLGSARHSTGFTMVSMALELCNNVHLYGFWPFSTHPYTRQKLTNHYFNNVPCDKVHNMPSEFGALLNLHKNGVINLHLGECAH